MTQYRISYYFNKLSRLPASTPNHRLTRLKGKCGIGVVLRIEARKPVIRPIYPGNHDHIVDKNKQDEESEKHFIDGLDRKP